MISEARRLAGSVIGPAIAEGVSKLRAAGEQAPFAGVIVGWETSLGQDFETRRNLGYCALTNLGFNQKRPPPDPDDELESALRNWTRTWAKSLGDAVVPRGKIYCHIVFTPRTQFDESRSDGRSYARSVFYTPPEVAFGDTDRPGFSTYPDAGVFHDIYAALSAHGNPAWASAEGTNVDVQSGRSEIGEENMETYLARMINHGAVLTKVFGWGIGDEQSVFRSATVGGEAIAAYRKFLTGAQLSEKPLDQSYRRGASILQGRMRALPARIQLSACWR